MKKSFSALARKFGIPTTRVRHASAPKAHSAPRSAKAKAARAHALALRNERSAWRPDGTLRSEQEQKAHAKKAHATKHHPKKVHAKKHHPPKSGMVPHPRDRHGNPYGPGMLKIWAKRNHVPMNRIRKA